MKHVFPRWLVASCLFFTLFSLNANDGFFTTKTLEKVEKRYGQFARRRVELLNDLMIKLKDAPEEEKITKVNDFFNRMRFTNDIKLWGVKDYWATRTEFIGKDAGDCEDFVIAKYFTLKQLGVPIKKLYFTYVKAVKLRQAHMVLTYFKKPKTVPLVLDNINFKILPATVRKDLIPVYSFNGDALFLAKQQGLGQIVPSGNKKNKKWLQLIDKLKKEDL